jgi:flagellar basal body rod protein FlgC
MNSGISAALSGVNAAITRLDVSAENIANLSSGTPTAPQQVVQSSLASGGVATRVQSASGNADLAQQVIDTSFAGYSAQANLISIKVWDETMQRALNIIA